jgi:hypothetical protein
MPASVEAYDMADVDDIGDALTLLAASGDPISMYAPGSRQVMLGRILSVDPELPHFVMELNEGVNLPAGKITFVAWLRTAKLQFQLADPAWKSQGKGNLIPMIFPEFCTVLNRRTSERLEAPLGINFVASFEMNGSLYELPLHDFSRGGLGLRCARRDAKGLFKGRKLLAVRLDLGDEVVIVPEMEIRLTRAYRSFLLGEQIHIGCKFVSLPLEAESVIACRFDQLNKDQRRR